jgi:prepilin-type processing-associated H-X9-DG protein
MTDESRNSPLTLLEVLVVIAVLAGLGVIVVSWMARAEREYGDVRCSRNQRQIHMALLMYLASGSNLAIPTSGSADEVTNAFTCLLSRYYMESPRILTCPSSDDRPAEGPPESFDPETNPLPAESISYGLSWNLADASPLTCAIIADRSDANHEGLGVHVCYVDGHVAWHETGRDRPLADLPAEAAPNDRIYADDPAIPDNCDSWIRSPKRPGP